MQDFQINKEKEQLKNSHQENQNSLYNISDLQLNSMNQIPIINN